MSRLRQTVNKGDRTVLVATDLDWVPGDELALMPTSMDHSHTDYVTVESYEIRTGEVVFSEALEYYHWGTETSTEQEYGIDMRGEIVLLSRNIQVTGTDV
jgi:hypothetical protein